MRRNMFTFCQNQPSPQLQQIPKILSNRSVVLPHSEEHPIKIINAYKLIQELGRGSFGQVYLAVNIMQQKFAMKISPEKMAKYTKIEAGILKRLEQFDISPKMIEAFEFEQQYCVVMSLCEQTLADFIRQDISINQRRTLMKNIAEQLNTLHENEIIHADIKTDNYLLLQKNVASSVKTIDYSSSIQLPATYFPTKLQSRYFKSPEVLHKKSYHKPIDCWSLGCLFFEIVFQRPLFPAKTDDMLCLQQSCLLGPIEYGDEQFMTRSTSYLFSSYSEQLTSLGYTEKSVLIPTSDVLDATGREECYPRTLSNLVSKLNWSDKLKNNYLILLNGLLQYDPKLRWTCEDVLKSDFFNGL
ncbi:Kinase [Hexamita inflata]|uniref:CMGC DYRK n=1 Tax=Hexamita inflata TaxID=28002 RepID=A0AA86TUA3_9EUKA|nr:CMGC DYRK [Hexamita inflata]